MNASQKTDIESASVSLISLIPLRSASTSRAETASVGAAWLRSVAVGHFGDVEQSFKFHTNLGKHFR